MLQPLVVLFSGCWWSSHWFIQQLSAPKYWNICTQTLTLQEQDTTPNTPAVSADTGRFGNIQITREIVTLILTILTMYASPSHRDKDNMQTQTLLLQPNGCKDSLTRLYFTLSQQQELSLRSLYSSPAVTWTHHAPCIIAPPTLPIIILPP